MPRAVIHPLNPEQAVTLIEKAGGDRLYALYLLALTGSLRQGELLGLRWSDLNLDDATVSVTRGLYYTKGSSPWWT